MTIVWFLGFAQYHGIQIPNPEIYNVSITLTKQPYIVRGKGTHIEKAPKSVRDKGTHIKKTA